jgi:hypothetical protein
MDVKAVFKALRPLKRRIHLNNAFICWAYAFILAGVLSFIMACTALFLPIPFVKDKLVAIYSIVVLAALLVSLFLSPKDMKTIKIGDSLGLKERLVTAYQLQNEETPIAMMQREDALKALSEADFKALYPLKPPISKFFIGCLLLILVLVTLVIPTGAKYRANNAENIINETKKQAKKLDDERNGLKKSSLVSDKKLDEINKKVDELLKNLNKSKNEEDALKSLSKAKHELDKLKNSTANKDLQKISEKLSQNELAKNLSQALKGGDGEEINKEIEELKEKLATADKKDLEELSEDLNEAAEGLEDNKLKEDLTALSEAIKSENMGSAANNLDALSADLANSLKNNPGSLSAMEQSENKSIDNLVEAINSSKYAISKQAGINFSASQSNGQQAGAQSGQNGNSAQGASGSQASNSGTASGQASNGGQAGQSGQSGQDGQNGQGSQGGQGNQSGNGSKGSGQGGSNGQGGGGGVGNSTSNKDAGYSEGQSSGGAKKPGDKKAGEYEAIYAPKRLGGDSQASQVNGTKNNSGQSQWSDVSSVPLGNGSTVPYSEVYEEYRDEAMAGLIEAQIPSGMKDMVRDYFTTLE